MCVYMSVVFCCCCGYGCIIVCVYVFVLSPCVYCHSCCALKMMAYTCHVDERKD